MSAKLKFQGVIREIPHIAVDYFRDVQTTSAFFLSHCHADHMVGLADSDEFYSMIKGRANVFIYCSPVTKTILSNWQKYSRFKEFFKALDVGEAHKIEVPAGINSFNMSVTPIANGHCPGSVMFLFEGNFGEAQTILYTGDFRIIKGDSIKLKNLMGNSEKPELGFKTIDHLYLDCTFCSEAGLNIPSRVDALHDTIRLIEEWKQEEETNHVFLSLSGKGFGAEFFFVEVYRLLKLKIHVPKEMHDIYRNIGHEIRDALTLSGSETTIHACGSCGAKDVMAPKLSLTCVKGKHKVRTFRLSTQWHLMANTNEANRSVVLDQGVYRVLYSMHSSLDELRDFVGCLKPRKITPIAMPDDVSLDKLHGLLKCLPDCSILAPVPRSKQALPSPTSTPRGSRRRNFSTPMARRSSSAVCSRSAMKRKEPENDDDDY